MTDRAETEREHNPKSGIELSSQARKWLQGGRAVIQLLLLLLKLKIRMMKMLRRVINMSSQ